MGGTLRLGFFRARRALTTTAIVVGLIAVWGVAALRAWPLSPYAEVPLSNVVALAGFAGIVVASVLAGTLARERRHRALAWTRPENRVLAAATTIAVDLVIVVACAGIAFVGVTATLAAAGVVAMLHRDASAVPLGFVMLGAASMWYGFAAASTALVRRQALAWCAWPVFLVGIAVDAGHIPRLAAFRPFLDVVNRANPLHYVDLSPFADYPAALSVLWTSALVALTLTTLGWARRDVRDST